MSFGSKSGGSPNTCTTNDIGSTQICHCAAVLHEKLWVDQRNPDDIYKLYFQVLNLLCLLLHKQYFYWLLIVPFQFQRHASVTVYQQAADTSLHIHTLLENLLILSYLSTVTAKLTYHATYSDIVHEVHFGRVSNNIGHINNNDDDDNTEAFFKIFLANL